MTHAGRQVLAKEVHVYTEERRLLPLRQPLARWSTVTKAMSPLKRRYNKYSLFHPINWARFQLYSSCWQVCLKSWILHLTETWCKSGQQKQGRQKSWRAPPADDDPPDCRLPPLLKRSLIRDNLPPLLSRCSSSFLTQHLITSSYSNIASEGKNDICQI